ncbi:Cytochrome P450 monooxygenase astJ [Paramyrothecium foliicola]|nr:Cytochrome P450 monooxygenase astJ [Paramyrothecium foliicola]
MNYCSMNGGFLSTTSDHKMKLLDIKKLEVIDFYDSTLPSYAFVCYSESVELPISNWHERPGQRQRQPLTIPSKLAGALRAAEDRNIGFLWLDCLFVDEPSAINAKKYAVRMLQQSTLCFVFLDDFPVGDITPDTNAWAQCKFWAQASALKILSLPPRVDLFDQGWNSRGSKTVPEILSVLQDIFRLHTWSVPDGDRPATKINHPVNASSLRENGAVNFNNKVVSESEPLGARKWRQFNAKIIHNTKSDHDQLDSHSKSVNDCSSQNLKLLPLRPVESDGTITGFDLEPPSWVPQGSGNFDSKSRSKFSEPCGTQDGGSESKPVIVPSLSTDAQEQCGVKRSRSGRPVRAIMKLQDDCTSDYSDSLSSSEGNSSEDSSISAGSPTDVEGSDEGDSVSDDSTFEEYDFAKDKEFGRLKQELFNSVYDKVQTWVASVRYTEPPHNELPSRKRAKTNHSPPSLVELQEDKEGSEFVVISHVDGYFHLACPFYVSNSTKYRQCLLQHDLRTIEELIEHLGTSHSEPLYCPICRSTFPKLAERDKHILERTCELRDSITVDGITSHLKSKLIKRDNFLVYRLGVICYRLYFHPLAKIPGPKLYGASNLPFLLKDSIQGRFVRSSLQLHQKYGPVVRIAPNQLAFDGSIGWSDIFAPRGNKPEFEKTVYFYGLTARAGLFTSLKEDHRRQRRLMGHAFSTTALLEQEGHVKHYVDLLIAQLKKQAETVGTVDICKWYNYTTFDIIGELAFADPFNSLANGNYHPWVAMIFDSIKSFGYMAVLNHFPLLKPLLALFVGKKEIQKRHESDQLAAAKTEKRMQRGVDEARKDFMTYIMRNNKNGQGMTHEEILLNSRALIVAGSETTATALSGVTFYLATNPLVYQHLAKEIRTSFRHDEEISIQSTARLPYLHACLEEILRIYPPAAVTPPRVSPGDTVGGYYVPEGTRVWIYQYATNHSALNFNQPETFAPERWLSAEHPLHDAQFDTDNKAACKPFSYGPRDCIGKNLAYAEMRLVLARMLWNFDFELEPGQEDWAAKQRVFVVFEKSPLLVRLKPVARDVNA